MSRLAVLVLACGCATTGALGVGPTIDSDGTVRLEGNASGGPVTDNNITAREDPQHGAIGVWSVGVAVALGIGARDSHGGAGA